MTIVSDRHVGSMEGLHAQVLQARVTCFCRQTMDVFVHESLNSTNDWSLQRCRAGQCLPFACFAELQTAGRGRRGKQWLMPGNANIAMSVCWPFEASRVSLSLLPLSIALAVVETLENLGLEQVAIKWPNDVYVRGRKIAGILIETRSFESALSERAIGAESCLMAVVIGVGLNIDIPDAVIKTLTHGATEAVSITDIQRELMHASPEALENPEINCHRPVDRNSVAAVLLQNIVTACQAYERDSAKNLAEYRNHYDYCTGRQVDVSLEDGAVLSGIARGVTDDAQLLVSIDGKLQSFDSAEVSVKADAS